MPGITGRETILELRITRGQRLGKPKRIEITAFRRRTIIAIGGGPIKEPLKNDDSEGAEMMQSVILEFSANDIQRTDDLMKLIEALLDNTRHK